MCLYDMRAIFGMGFLIVYNTTNSFTCYFES
jgi:hypothetical protein